MGARPLLGLGGRHLAFLDPGAPASGNWGSAKQGTELQGAELNEG
jgi:hypothetical protein